MIQCCFPSYQRYMTSLTRLTLCLIVWFPHPQWWTTTIKHDPCIGVGEMTTQILLRKFSVNCDKDLPTSKNMEWHCYQWWTISSGCRKSFYCWIVNSKSLYLQQWLSEVSVDIIQTQYPARDSYFLINLTPALWTAVGGWAFTVLPLLLSNLHSAALLSLQYQLA